MAALPVPEKGLSHPGAPNEAQATCTATRVTSSPGKCAPSRPALGHARTRLQKEGGHQRALSWLHGVRLGYGQPSSRGGMFLGNIGADMTKVVGAVERGGREASGSSRAKWEPHETSLRDALMAVRVNTCDAALAKPALHTCPLNKERNLRRPLGQRAALLPMPLSCTWLKASLCFWGDYVTLSCALSVQ